jgi:hypothetical protein
MKGQQSDIYYNPLVRSELVEQSSMLAEQHSVNNNLHILQQQLEVSYTATTLPRAKITFSWMQTETRSRHQVSPSQHYEEA